MAYHPLFDEGPCDVHSSIFGEIIDHGLKTKGDTWNYFSPGLSATFTFTIGLDGSVKLQGPDTTVTGSTVFDVWVVPSVSVSGRTAQLLNPAMGGNYGRRFGYADHATGGTYAAFTQAQPALPSPMTLGFAPVAIGMSISANP